MKEVQSYSSLTVAEPEDFLPSISRWMSLGGVALLIVCGGVMTLAATLPYRTTIKAPATIRPEGELRLVEASLAGTVKQIAVKPNDAVGQGDVIAYLMDDELRSQEQQLQGEVSQTQLQLAQIQAQVQALQAQAAAEDQAMVRAVAAADDRLAAAQRTYQDQQVTTQTDVREAKAAVQFAQEELKRYEQLAGTGVISEIQTEEKRAALESALARLERSQVLLNPSEAAVAEAQENMAQAAASGEATLARLTREKEQLLQQQSNLQQQLQGTEQRLAQVRLDLGKLALRSPVAGRIQELTLRNPGQVVEPGKVVAQIAPEAAPLTVKALVGQDAVSQVELGQLVSLRVDSCVYTDYGTLPGRVSVISPDAKVGAGSLSGSLSGSAAGAAGSGVGGGESAYYEVEIAPERLVLEKAGRDCVLQAGMRGRADIIAREETILRAWLRKLRLVADV